MSADILEIAQDGRHLSLYRGFVKISQSGVELARVPLDGLEAMLISGHGITFSKNLLEALAERNILATLCGRNYQPVSLCLPTSGHYQSAGVLWDQMEATQPLKKRLWQSIIKQKILNQRLVLKHVKPKSTWLARLEMLEKKVASGDSDNKEAQAARLYWPELMGESFRRNKDLPGTNAMLNYGYTILRSAVARSLVSTGLHPALGIHHKNRLNAFCLADDLIEPFRPFVDFLVVQQETISEVEPQTLTPDLKRQLASVLEWSVNGDKGLTNLSSAISKSALSLRESFQNKKVNINLPELKPELIKNDSKTEGMGEWV